MIIAWTGHRPDKLGGYDRSNPLKTKIQSLLDVMVFQFGKIQCISGMALGVDQWIAEGCVDRGIDFIAAVPCKNQERLWPQESQQAYRRLLTKASKVVTLAEEYGPSVMQDRNVWMVNNADLVVAIWNGSTGGTKNCVNYCKSINKTIVVFNPSKL